MTFSNMSVAAAAAITLATTLTLSSPVQVSETCKPIAGVSADRMFQLSTYMLAYENTIHVAAGNLEQHTRSQLTQKELGQTLTFMKRNLEFFIKEDLGSPDLGQLGRFIQKRLHSPLNLDRPLDDLDEFYENLMQEMACAGVEGISFDQMDDKQLTKNDFLIYTFSSRALYQAGADHHEYLEMIDWMYEDDAAKRCGVARIDISEAVLAKGVFTEYRRTFASLVGDIPDEERAARLKRLEAVRAVAERLDWSSAHARAGIDDLSHENVRSDFRHGRDVARGWVRHMGPLNPDFSPLACARSGAQREGSQGLAHWLALEYGQFKLHLFLADVERRLT